MINKLNSKDLFELLEAAFAADYTRLRRVVVSIAKEIAPSDPDTAAKLHSMIRRRGVPLRTSGYMESLPVDAKSRLPLIEEQSPPSLPVFLNQSARQICEAFVGDVKNSEALSEKGLSSPLSLMLSGQPGTGKSLLAGHIASQLGRTLYVVRLDSAISSLLGDTAKNIRAIFEFVPGKDAVLFLDEMDAIAKLRDDRNELGELKRVVNTVIQGLDSLDHHAVVIAATNHPQLLDPAIWRRFPYKIDLDLPDLDVREALWRFYLFEDQTSEQIEKSLAKISAGLSGNDIQNIGLAARRYAVLDNRDLDIGPITSAVLDAREGKVSVPKRDGLAPERKRFLMSALVDQGEVNQSDAAKLLGVTRQAVSKYLKEHEGGVKS